MASNQAFQKQAESASDAARKYMEENEKLQEVSEWLITGRCKHTTQSTTMKSDLLIEPVQSVNTLTIMLPNHYYAPKL